MLAALTSRSCSADCPAPMPSSRHRDRSGLSNVPSAAAPELLRQSCRVEVLSGLGLPAGDTG